jgi:hypothetical protein
VKIHDQGRARDGAVRFRAPAAGVFSYLWKNEGTTPATLEVTAQLPPGVTVHSWHPAP